MSFLKVSSVLAPQAQQGMLLILHRHRKALGKDGGLQRRAPVHRTYHAPQNTWNRSSANAIAYAKLKFSNNLLSCCIDPLWDVCAIIKHCSNLCFSGNNYILSHQLRVSLKTWDETFHTGKIVVASQCSFLFNNALLGKCGNLFPNKCLLCLSEMPVA